MSTPVVEKAVKVVKTENCVRCGGDTGVPSTMYVEFRPCYVDGAGDLCWGCYRAVYPPPPPSVGTFETYLDI